MAEIRVEGIGKTYDKKYWAVNDVDLTVADGEFVVLLGPSGCGKTTLLRAIAGLEYPERGRVLLGDRDITSLPPRKRKIAMVFQSYAVFPHLKVADNIGFGLRMAGMGKREIREKVERAAELVELSDFLDRYPAKLSGGQRQRVAVARAIVMEPPVLLMDEPLSNLDALLRLNFRAELKKLVADLQTTTIYVTHDQVEALSLGDRIAVMREGRIVQCATPMEVYDRPATQFVGGFIGNPPMNFLRGQLRNTNGTVSLSVGQHELPLPGDGAWPEDGAGGDRDVLIGIRAESIEASERPAPGTVEALTEVVEPLGASLMVTAAIDDQRVKLLARNDFPAKPDERLWIRPEPDKLRLYDPENSEAL